ncbi:unnamed protein product [Arabidopsis lyrata]|uniref:Predicted protein n=1 Tax=Arabidopsis lyrata subsp. lyrata TaxID=81972 RepID=D7LMI7_ARALL|nr:predicted protein [Arabidopsis lyrata subsp. lyrata]CAH8267375.1 unnamed protein product [Arabidopsis lyrata]
MIADGAEDEEKWLAVSDAATDSIQCLKTSRSPEQNCENCLFHLLKRESVSTNFFLWQLAYTKLLFFPVL